MKTDSQTYQNKKEEKHFKGKLRGFLFTERLFSLLFLVFYIPAWGAFVRLCLYGDVRKNLPVLAVCVLFFLVLLMCDKEVIEV